MLDYVERLFTDFHEMHGDRRFGDDGAVVAGFARYKDEPVLRRRPPEGPRHEAEDRAATSATRGPRATARRCAPCGWPRSSTGRSSSSSTRRPRIRAIESEERGISEAIALNLREMAVLDVPIVVLITGEGGSGGALGLAVGDRVLMQEFAIYSVIPPEGCAAILWRDANQKIAAAEALKITAPDLRRAWHRRRDRARAEWRRPQRPGRGRRRCWTRPSPARSAR